MDSAQPDQGRTGVRAGSPAALLLRDFVNTLDVECATDAIDAPARLADWLAAHGLAPAGARADQSDVDLAATLREGLRTAMLAHHTLGAAASPLAGGGLPGDLERSLGRLPLRLTLDGGRPALVPLGGGTTAGLARIAAAVTESAADGTWPRLKVCLEDTCQWAFLDTSKNRSRSWCSMRVCGNRTKTRAYRARRRDRTATR
ncbi:CGNR zinc finger domain-containing protein [Actinomadura rugatobispora]|uniref:CGNR zinc finger domain-containing protein n=1 Tax=Actinomadura rugatobispora TaxID=1994 RepID=A0ABW1AG29_9ACTN|nr:CGNR zinc finger domain-containing protein [Actinomadura rugatobispora]